MKRDFVYGEWFCGNKISDYGIEHGYVDYATLAKAFDAVLNNDIMAKTDGVIGYWELCQGGTDNSDRIEEIEDEMNEIQDQIDSAEDELEGLDDAVSEDCDRADALEETICDLKDKMSELEDEKDELEDEQERFPEVFQWYIISAYGAEILEDYTDELVWYNEELDMYVWGVTHWGTSWDYVLTDIRCNAKEEQ